MSCDEPSGDTEEEERRRMDGVRVENKRRIREMEERGYEVEKKETTRERLRGKE